MICLVLAAGYATRLYPLTENFPKPLLKIGNSTILDRLVDDVASTGFADEFVVVTNHRFYNNFQNWAAEKSLKITVVDDGTETNETRLGAVVDICYAAEKLSLDDDLLVIAGDNVLDFSLKSFIEYSKEKNAPCVMRHFESERKKLSKTGVLIVDDSDKVYRMQEKPANPGSNWCCPPFYYYPAEFIKAISAAVESGCATDAPGSLVEWFCKRTDLYAMEMSGHRYDVGDIESYSQVCRMFDNK